MRVDEGCIGLRWAHLVTADDGRGELEGVCVCGWDVRERHRARPRRRMTDEQMTRKQHCTQTVSCASGSATRMSACASMECTHAAEWEIDLGSLRGLSAPLRSAELLRRDFEGDGVSRAPGLGFRI